MHLTLLQTALVARQAAAQAAGLACLPTAVLGLERSCAATDLRSGEGGNGSDGRGQFASMMFHRYGSRRSARSTSQRSGMWVYGGQTIARSVQQALHMSHGATLRSMLHICKCLTATAGALAACGCQPAAGEAKSGGPCCPFNCHPQI